MNKIVIACDHGGYLYKEEIKKFLIEKNYDVIDVGCNSQESCNYALFAIKAAEHVSSKIADFGILICTSGEGVAIAANKVKDVRCGIGYNDEVSKLVRVHNNCNMISFGAKYMSLDEVKKRTLIFLNAKFEGGRHEERVNYINNYKKF